MSDEKSTPEKKPIEAPSLAFVKGGSSTAKNDQMWEARFREAEARRDRQEFERKVASVPIEDGGAQRYSSQMTAHPEVPRAYVRLKYMTAGGDETGVECLADVIIGMDASNPLELTLIIVCPRCAQRGDKHLQDCQLQIRQSNKRFELRTGMGEPTFMYEGSLYKSAGVVTECEKFRCPDCSWSAQINNNKIYSD